MKGLSKKKKKTRGHRQQCDGCQWRERGWGEVEEDIGGTDGDGGAPGIKVKVKGY